MSELILVRHTCVTVSGVCYGRSEVPLAESFVTEAAQIKNQLVNLDVSAYYSSPAQRCMDLAYHLSANIHIDDRLTELNFGAGKHHNVRVDVTGSAFASDNTVLISTWAKGVTRLCKVLGKNNSDLLIFYHQGGETGELAQGRVDALEATIRQTCDPKHSLKIKKQVAEGK